MLANILKPETLSKVPAVTLCFWTIKITATTLGETGGDAVTMTLKLGYLIGTGIFGVILLAALGAQMAAKRFQPFRYWAVVAATTTVGTTLADLSTARLGLATWEGRSFYLLSCSLHWARGIGRAAPCL